MDRTMENQQITVSTASTGEVRLYADLMPEEIRIGVYLRGLSPKAARALATELLRAADVAEAEEADLNTRQS